MKEPVSTETSHSPKGGAGRGLTRGQRNNNPLNIRKVAGQHWRGEVVSPIRDKEFVEFCSLEHGIRAAFCILDTYKKKYPAVCIEDIIARWAPPSENDTPAYIRNVCLLTGFGGKERLTETQWPTLVKAMALIESRMNLSDELLERAMQLYSGK